MACGEVGPPGPLVQSPVGRVTEAAGEGATTRCLLGRVMTAKEEAMRHNPVIANFALEW